MSSEGKSMNRDVWSGLELRHLAALSAVASERSFRAAADSLGYVQSAVSYQIASLERLVGHRLIERSPGPSPVRCTAAGEMLLEHAGYVLDRIEIAKADLGLIGDGRAGTLRVGVCQAVATRVISRTLALFASRWPEVRVEASEFATDE